jgi:hypothetical protein
MKDTVTGTVTQPTDASDAVNVTVTGGAVARAANAREGAGAGRRHREGPVNGAVNSRHGDGRAWATR